MADEFQEKTEEPTPKKLADARRKGQVAKSQDFTSSAVLFTGMFLLFVFSGYFYDRLEMFTLAIFNHLTEPFDSFDAVVGWMQEGLKFCMLLLLPLFLGLLTFGLVVNIIQVGWEVSLESLKPKWNNVNVFNPKNYKKFFNVQAVVKLLLGISKLLVIGFVGYLIIFQRLGQVTRLMDGTPWEMFIFLCQTAFLMGIVTAVILLSLGILDFLFQKWKFQKDMRMSRTEVKDERKQTEGDAQMKGKIRSMMQSFSQTRMKDNVPKADVVVANPIHYAIAIKYDPETMPAPVCVAKGARRMALIIRELAETSGVAVVENPPLARALYKSVEVGSLVPPDFYHAIAEVLAYVYRIDEEKGAKIEESTSERR